MFTKNKGLCSFFIIEFVKKKKKFEEGVVKKYGKIMVNVQNYFTLFSFLVRSRLLAVTIRSSQL